METFAALIVVFAGIFAWIYFRDENSTDFDYDNDFQRISDDNDDDSSDDSDSSDGGGDD